MQNRLVDQITLPLLSPMAGVPVYGDPAAPVHGSLDATVDVLHGWLRAQLNAGRLFVEGDKPLVTVTVDVTGPVPRAPIGMTPTPSHPSVFDQRDPFGGAPSGIGVGAPAPGAAPAPAHDAAMLAATQDAYDAVVFDAECRIFALRWLLARVVSAASDDKGEAKAEIAADFLKAHVYRWRRSATVFLRDVVERGARWRMIEENAAALGFTGRTIAPIMRELVADIMWVCREWNVAYVAEYGGPLLRTPATTPPPAPADTNTNTDENADAE